MWCFLKTPCKHSASRTSPCMKLIFYLLFFLHDLRIRIYCCTGCLAPILVGHCLIILYRCDCQCSLRRLLLILSYDWVASRLAPTVCASCFWRLQLSSWMTSRSHYLGCLLWLTIHCALYHPVTCLALRPTGQSYLCPMLALAQIPCARIKQLSPHGFRGRFIRVQSITVAIAGYYFLRGQYVYFLPAFA